MEKEIRKLLEGLEIDQDLLSEKAIKKMSLMFEAKVNGKVKLIEAKLDKRNDAELEEFKSEMVEKIDEYMNYFAGEYIEENKNSIEDAVTVKTAKVVLEKFNGMVQDFNMSLDEDTINQEEEMTELKEQLNASVNKSLVVQEQLIEATKKALINESAADIEIESERDSFIALAENFDFDNPEAFEENLTFLKENINTSTEEFETLEESETGDNQGKVLEESSEIKSGPMPGYLQVFSKKSA